jgi:hypothetical protein
VQDYIGNQTAPLVLPTAGNPVFNTADSWLAYGGCPVIENFDAVSPGTGTEVIAEFAGPDGDPGGYEFPAATFRFDDVLNNQYVYLPYDLRVVQIPPTNGKQVVPLSPRAEIVLDVLTAFGQLPGSPVNVPAPLQLVARNHPNPFNPQTTITFTLPRAGGVSLKVYDVRGRMVRTLLDDAVLERGEHAIVWRGQDDRGGRVASGVYFYELRSGDQRRVEKMALVQ